MTALIQTPPTTARATPSVDRARLIGQARDNWIRKLIDLSRRNNLLYYRNLRKGTLDLSGHDVLAMTALMNGSVVPLARLMPGLDEGKIAPQVQEIRRRALANLEEKGLSTLFVAYGMATWAPNDAGRPADAAVLLIPVAIEVAGRGGRGVALKRSGEVQVNPVLLHALEAGHGVRAMPEALLADVDFDNDRSAFDPAPIFDRLLLAGRRIPGFAVMLRSALGNFSFQKMAIVRDLQVHTAALENHGIVAALVGDAAARHAIRQKRREIPVHALDQVHPDREYLILDADSSQQRVVVAVAEGQTGVVQGPPGTGKSQTIANLIATLAAQGKRVLFVAEKRAALDVVLRRLEDVGLEHLALDLHGADISRKNVIQQLGDSLHVVRDTPPVSADDLHRRFVERRDRLGRHVQLLHRRRDPSTLSAFELQGRLLALASEVKSRTRWRGGQLAALTPDVINTAGELLSEGSGFGALFLGDDGSPWGHAPLNDGHDVQRALEAAEQVRDLTLRLGHATAELVAGTGLVAPTSLAAIDELLTLLGDTRRTLSVYASSIFEADLAGLVDALAPARRGWFASTWAACFNGLYRRAKRELLGYRTSGGAPVSLLLQEVEDALDQHDRWCRNSARPLDGVPDPIDVATLHSTVMEELGTLARLSGKADLGAIPLVDLQRVAEELLADAATAYKVPRLLQIRDELARLGVSALIEEFGREASTPDVWTRMLHYAWLASCFDAFRADHPEAGGFNGETHDGYVAEFCALDRQRLEVASTRVRRTHAERVIEALNRYPDQDAVVRREVAKRSRHQPLRNLFELAPDVLTALRPCWMASPLSVSQLLPADKSYFDVVLYDEASQILPEDAVASLLRASQAVVAGDQRQLPPTTFFASGEEDDSSPDEVSGFESFLDIMAGLVEPWWLEWHYRSKDERLITFSNRHVYEDRLVTLPSPGGPSALRHVLVPHVTGLDDQEESASKEVQRVVELVLEHAEKYPALTLGVIAMGIKHAQRVQDALDAALAQRSDLDSFFDESNHERFFVKNLERVQGDERDAIILTIGYGKDKDGRLPYRFGPLLVAGGERRLNVAVTRARAQMTVVSSFTHHDMDPSRSNARGVQLLRDYLEYVVEGSGQESVGTSSRADLSEFECDLYETLRGCGMVIAPRYGAARSRVEFAVQHPDVPGRYVLALECDGEAYRDTGTVRDRDRLRPQQLEALNWRHLRVWSFDWFSQRQAQVARIRTALSEAAAEADRLLGASVTKGGDSVAISAAGVDGLITHEQLIGVTLAPQMLARGPRPYVPRRPSIDEYARRELISLVRWVRSDGYLRTDDEILQEIVRELGFSRRGSRIEAAIRDAIRAAQ